MTLQKSSALQRCAANAATTAVDNFRNPADPDLGIGCVLIGALVHATEPPYGSDRPSPLSDPMPAHGWIGLVGCSHLAVPAFALSNAKAAGLASDAECAACRQSRWGPGALRCRRNNPLDAGQPL